MPYTNPFFSTTTGYTGEQNLIDSLVIEQIGMFGLDIMYMPRENVNLDSLLHESTKDVFSLAMSIPMYVKSYDGYDNSMEMLTKFGVRASDELTLIMSRSQWSAFYAPYVKSFYNAQSGRPDQSLNNPLEGQTSRRPKEGDLIYFPFDGGIFEIKYVAFDQPFFQLGKGYIYEMQCEKFEYSGEDFKTGIPEIDNVTIRSDFPTVEFDMIDGGVSTFTFKERVKIYNVSDIDFTDLTTDTGQQIVTEDLKFIRPDDLDVFQMYNDAGFMRQIPFVEATVEKWNVVDRKLAVSDLTDLNPTQIDATTGNVSIETFEKVLVVGEKSLAAWTSSSSQQTEKPFDDAEYIQEEFNKIKIYDPEDAPPFGFY